MKRYALLTVVLLVALLLTPATALAAPQPVVYTAFGDSIAKGTGGTGFIGYTDLLAAHLARGHRDVTYNDLGKDGVTSPMLLMSLTNPASPDYATYNGAAASAGVITVSIGGNDLLQPIVAFVQANPQYADPAYLASLSPAERAALAATVYGLLGPQIAQFTATWPSTAAYLRAVNPSAEIYVNTLYNPFKPGDGLYELFDPFLDAMNAVIVGCAANPACDYTVVDVYARFDAYGNPKKPAVHPLMSPVALHPTDAGYKFICNLVKNEM